MRYIKVYFHFLAQHLKSLMEYRVDFFIGILSFVFTQEAGIIFLEVLVKKTGILNWNYYELLVIYGLFQIPRGLDHLFTDNLWLISRYVRMGLFDKYLIKPVNVLFHIIAERFQPEAFGELIVGIFVLALALPKLAIEVTFGKIVYLIIFIIIGAVIYTSIKLITSSLAFWTKDSQPIVSVTYNVATFTKNPIEIYPAPIRFLLVHVLPFGFTSYFPSVFLLNKMEGNLGLDWILVKTPAGLLVQALVICILFVGISLIVWNAGLRNYESAGS